MPFTCWPWILAAGTYHLIDDRKEKKFGALDLYFKGSYGIIYWDLNALKDLASSFYSLHIQKDAYNKIYNKYLVQSAVIEDLYLKIHADAGKKYNESEIVALFANLKSAYEGFWEHSLFIDAFDTGIDQEKITEIAKEYGLAKKDVEVLTTPTEMTFADEQKFALLQLVKLGEYKNVQKIDAYRKKFDYYKSNYTHIQHISNEEIEGEVKKYLLDKATLKDECRRLENYSKDKQGEHEKVLSKYRLNENPLWFFAGMTYWREHRKKINLMGIHVLDVILLETEKKTGIPKKHLTYLSFDEFENVLKGLIPGSLLARRYNEGVFVAMRDDGYKIYDGTEAVSLKNELEQMLSATMHEATVIHGQTASQGYAKGIARVVLTQDDFGKFQEGEVLVTSMTRPEFVPLMKKSVAIVTNEGGITCHAAIVSRELGKPCVIGTKNATQRIKNGDLIEVRANHGTVRIL